MTFPQPGAAVWICGVVGAFLRHNECVTITVEGGWEAMGKTEREFSRWV